MLITQAGLRIGIVICTLGSKSFAYAICDARAEPLIKGGNGRTLRG